MGFLLRWWVPITAGELFKTITVNEHNKQVIEFKDKEGQVILKKVQINGAGDNGAGLGYSNWLCTYYVYDDLNRLRLVIPPLAVNHLVASNWSNATLLNVLPNLCFRYEYDARGRMIRKKVADGGEAWMVYDARDRLVLIAGSGICALAIKGGCTQSTMI